MLDAVLRNMRVHSGVGIEGFITPAYSRQYSKLLEFILPCIKEWKVECVADMVEGLENHLATLIRLFKVEGFGASARNDRSSCLHPHL